jgi:hypothetical protein
LSDSSYGYNGRDDWQAAYNVEIPANSKRIVMHLVAAADTLEQAQSLAEQLQTDAQGGWTGISDADSAQIVNMQPAATVTPSVELFVPAQASFEEGRTVELSATATLADAVDFYVNDVKVYTSTKEPHIYRFTLPRIANVGNSVTVQAKGMAAGIEQQSAAQQINLVERTKADITGRVMLESAGVSTPVEAAVVTIEQQQYTVTTDIDGYFTLSAAFIDEALNISVNHEQRGERIIWEEITAPQAVAGVVNLGDIVFRDDDPSTLYDESIGNEIAFTGSASYQYFTSTGMTYRGHKVDYLYIDRAGTYMYLYDQYGYNIEYIRPLPINNAQYQRLGGVRVKETADYIAITFDSMYLSGVANSGMTTQVQIHSDGDIRIVYGSTAIDVGSYLSGYTELYWRGNDSGNYVLSTVDFLNLSLDNPQVNKPYHRNNVREYFYSGSAFDLMGRVLEYDYDLNNDIRVWSEPLTSVPVPLQYLQ